MSDLVVQVSSEPGVRVVAVAGELDVATSGVLRQRLSDVCATVPLVVDMSGVTFMDSAGLHALLDTQRVRGAESIRLRGVHKRVLRVLDITAPGVFIIE